MQFSSAKATVRNHLIGGTANNTIEDYHATDLGELSLSAFEKARGTRGPVSAVEQALAELPAELGRDEQRKSMGCVSVLHRAHAFPLRCHVIDARGAPAMKVCDLA